MRYALLAFFCIGLSIMFSPLFFAGCATQEKALLRTECVGVASNIGRMTACPMPGNVICYEKGSHFACVQILGPRI